MSAYFYRFRLCLFYLCLACFLPFVAHTEPIGEIIFRHPADSRGLWIGNVNSKRNSRKLLDVPLLIETLSIQKGNRYLVSVASRWVEDELDLGQQVYLLDREAPFVKAKNLTQGQYGDILDVAISRNGDVVFTNSRDVPLKDGKMPIPGPYLLQNHEIKKRHPQAELLFPATDGGCVDWAPNGREIAFGTADGIFLIDVFTRKVSHIIKDGKDSAFSPNGKYLAFATLTIPSKLGILSLTVPHNIKYIEVEEGTFPRDLTWSPDGQYIVYTLFNAVNTRYSNFAVPVAGGPSERILKMYDGGVSPFDWTNVTYAVEPTYRLTTLWGKLKQRDGR